MAEQRELQATGPVSRMIEGDKVYARPALSGARVDYRLSAVVSLRRSPSEAFALRALTGAEAFSALDDNIYRREWIGVLREPPELFAQIAACLRLTQVFAFARPRDLGRLEEGAAHLAGALLKETPASD